MPSPYSDEDYEKITDLDREISHLRRVLKQPLSTADVRTSDFDESVDYELPLLDGDYYVNAIKSKASYKIVVTDEDGNFVSPEGEIIQDPYVTSVVQISDLDSMRKDMVKAGKAFIQDYVGSKLYELEEKRSDIESKYEDEDFMTVAHNKMEDEMLGEAIDVKAEDSREQAVIDRLNRSNFMATGWTTRKDDIIEELLDLGFSIVYDDPDRIEFSDEDNEDEDRTYLIELSYVGTNTIVFEYKGYEVI